MEDSLQFWLESLAFNPWGFRELRVDHEALAAGVFTISRASGILRDGLLFEIPDADPAPPGKPLGEHFGPNDSSLDIYLAVPQYRERGLNVSIPEAASDTRYLASAVFVPDEGSAGMEKPIQVARKGFRLLTDSESRQGYSSLRIARVERTPAGAFQLDPRFVPPLIDLSASELLVTIARRLYEILGAKSSELSSLRREKNQSLADFTSSEIADFWMLYAINTNFPAIRHIFEVRRGHPEALFGAMTALATSLTTFSTDVHPRDLPIYDHDDLSACFTVLDTKLRALLETTVPKNYVAVALKQVQPSTFAGSLAEERFFQNTRMYLAVRADMDRGDLIGKVPRLVKVGAATHIDHMVRRALPGIPLTHTVRPPAGLPVRMHYEYFNLSQAGEVWESITRARNLAAYIPEEFPSVEVELIILLAQGR